MINITLSIILGFIIGINYKKLHNNLIENSRHRNRIKITSQWINMDRDAIFIIKNIDSSFSSDHRNSMRRMVETFRKKYWVNVKDYSLDDKRSDIFNERKTIARRRYEMIRDHLMDHFVNSGKINKAKSEWLKNNREKRFQNLMDK